MTYRNAREVQKRVLAKYNEITLLIQMSPTDIRVVTESAYYYDPVRKHNQLFGTPQQQK